MHLGFLCLTDGCAFWIVMSLGFVCFMDGCVSRKVVSLGQLCLAALTPGGVPVSRVVVMRRCHVLAEGQGSASPTTTPLCYVKSDSCSQSEQAQCTPLRAQLFSSDDEAPVTFVRTPHR